MKYPIRAAAIRVSQPLGDFWAISLPAKVLRQCVSLDPTRIESVDRQSFLYKLLGNQREASIPRSREIARYINSVESAFPNSIILAANYSPEGPIPEDAPMRWTVSKEDDSFYVTIPSDSKAAVIIDGQHRLLGFDHAIASRQSMELLCAIYFDLPQAYQAYLFATININQRKVDKSLAYEQFGYNLDDEPPIAWAPEKLAVYFSRKLNLDPTSPFYQHIKLAPLNAELLGPEDSAMWQVSTACIVEGILSLISSKPAADRDTLHAVATKDRNRASLPDDASPLREEYRKGQDDLILRTISGYFDAISNSLWSTANERSYINKTIGVSALFDVLKHLLLKYSKEDLPARLTHLIASTRDIDFSAPFYQASGKGRTRIRNVLLRAANEIRGDDLPKADASAYAVYAQSSGAYR